MFAILAHVRPLDLATGERRDVRVASSPGPGFQSLGGFVWESAIRRRPRAAIELFALDLSAGVRAATGDLELSLTAIKEVDLTGLYWPGAPITLYRADDLAWPAPVEMSGTVTTAPRDLERDTLVLNIRVSTDMIEKPLLVGEFSGGGGINGEPDMRGTLMPAGFGKCMNVEPVMIDKVRNIAMVDGYGNLIGVDWVGEGLASLGDSVGDFADYGALAAAIDAKVIAPGRWATCLASGLIGFGAPPVGIITAHIRCGFGMTGALVRRVLRQHAGVAADRIEGGSLVALDAAVPYPVHFWTAEQVTVRDLVEQLCAACNAAPLVTFQNIFMVVRPFGGVSIGTLRRFGYSEPAVRGWRSADPLTPYWQLRLRTARPVRVLDLDQVNYEDDIVNRGIFDPAETYRQGNTVWTDDGAQWLYRNPTPSAGHIPPADADLDDWWRRLKEQTNAQVAAGLSDAEPIVAGKTYKKGDIGTDQGATWIYSTNLVWDGTMPPALPAESNAYWQLLKDATAVSLKTNVAAIIIQADYTGTPVAGQLPAIGRGILYVGNAVTTGAIWSLTASGCDAIIDQDGGFQINVVRTSGYIDVKASYRDKTYTSRVTITVNNGSAPAGPAPGDGGTPTPSAEITQFPEVSSLTYPTAPASIAAIKASAAGLKFSGYVTYTAASKGGKVAGSVTLYAKVLYRAQGSTAWTDAIAEVAGTQANSGAYPDYESYDGFLDFSELSLTGLTAGTTYEFGVIFRRTGNSNTYPYGYARGEAA